jgi:hypothetical protein
MKTNKDLVEELSLIVPQCEHCFSTGDDPHRCAECCKCKTSIFFLSNIETYKKELLQTLEAKDQAWEQEVERVREEKEEILESLEDMYRQYCYQGHAFMSAGEHAQYIIEKYGTLKLGGAGEIIDTPPTTNQKDV